MSAMRVEKYPNYVLCKSEERLYNEIRLPTGCNRHMCKCFFVSQNGTEGDFFKRQWADVAWKMK